MTPSEGINSYPLRLFYVPYSNDTAAIVYRNKESLDLWKATAQISSISHKVIFQLGGILALKEGELGQKAQFRINPKNNPVRIAFMHFKDKTSLSPFFTKFEIEVDRESYLDEEFRIERSVPTATPLLDIEDDEQAYENDADQKMEAFSILTSEEEQSLVADLKKRTGTSDIVEAVSHFLENMDHDQAEDLLIAAHCYYFGIGINVDYGTAAFFYQTAAGQNSTTALIQFAIIHVSKMGIIGRDPELAEEYLKKASSLGDSKADVVLGFCYQGGYFDDIDVNAALKAFKQASQRGNLQGTLQLVQLNLMMSNNHPFHNFDLRK
ncbi:MAG: tetratricopeptide repeat protein [Parachlamydiaceae bacterium]